MTLGAIGTYLLLWILEPELRRYRLSDGRCYDYLGEAEHTVTGEPMVAYRATGCPQEIIWLSPLADLCNEKKFVEVQ